MLQSQGDSASTVPQGTTCILADSLIDGTGGDPIVDVAITVDGGRIASVARRRTGWSPAPRAEIADWRGCTVIPGLIDSHVHLAMSAASTTAEVIQQLVSSSAEEALLGAQQRAQRALVAGVTTLRDCGGPGRLTIQLRDTRNAGFWTGPRLVVSGRPITTTAGHCHWMGFRADTGPELIKAVRQLCEQQVDFIKIMVTGGNMTAFSNPASLQYSPDDLKAAVDEAHRLGRKVAGHVLCADGVRAAMRAGVDTLEHGWSVSNPAVDFSQELAEELSRSGSMGSVTAHADLRALLPDSETDGIVALQERLIPHRGLRSAGVPLVVHSDAGTPQTRFEDFAQSVEAFMLGLETDAVGAVQAATQLPARALGLESEIGTIEVGRQADLISLRGDLGTDIRSLRRVGTVMLAGRVVAEEGLLHIPGQGR